MSAKDQILSGELRGEGLLAAKRHELQPLMIIFGRWRRAAAISDAPPTSLISVGVVDLQGVTGETRTKTYSRRSFHDAETSTLNVVVARSSQPQLPRFLPIRRCWCSRQSLHTQPFA
jgi:hypothetical protein